MLLSRRISCKTMCFLPVLMWITTSIASPVSVALSSGLESSAPAVTGGIGGDHVVVRTQAELENQLCRRRSSDNICSDAEPRIIEVVGAIDYKNSEGQETSTGCYYDPRNPEKALLTVADPANACIGPNIRKQQIAYDKAGTHPLLVGSNKTVVGHDAYSKVIGRGFMLRHVENVIIRNLTVSDINPAVIWAGDAVDLSDVKDVWVDHNAFSLVGRQMIVGHFGKQDNVVISSNIFDGKTPFYSQGHYWNILFIGTQPTKVIIRDNWFRNFSGRSPALHAQGRFDIMNNLFQDGDGHALEVHDSVNVLLEGNVFKNVSQPIMGDGGRLFAPIAGGRGTSDICKKFLGRPCEINQVIGSRAAQGFSVPPDALSIFSQSTLPRPRNVDTVTNTVASQAGPH